MHDASDYAYGAKHHKANRVKVEAKAKIKRA